MIPSILTLNFGLVLGSFLAFWGWGKVQKLSWGLLMLTTNFSFQRIAISISISISCSFEFVVVVGCGFQRLLSLNLTTSFGCFVVGVVVAFVVRL